MNLPRLIVYSYLDLQTVLKKISRISHSERDLLLNQIHNGSYLYFKGKKHKFKLGSLLSNTCLEDELSFQNIWNQIKMGLNLCERIEFEVNMTYINYCPEHTKSGNLAYFLHKLP